MSYEQKPPAAPGQHSSQAIPGVDQTHSVTPESLSPGLPAESNAEGLPKWLRLGLIGFGVALVLFFAGFATDHFSRYQPMKKSLEATIAQKNDELQKANEQIADLQGQILKANDQLGENSSKIANLETNITGFEKDVEAAATHIELLTAVREIQSAHVALFSGDVSGAKVALSGTLNRLENLKPVVATMDSALSENMTIRLNMILNGMETDIETAKADLSLLSKNLLNVETLLY